MKTPLEALTHDYVEAFGAYLGERGEMGLTRAYELGRRALNAGFGLLDISTLHRAVLSAFMLPAAAADQPRVAKAANEFFSELLAPFEMSLQGYRDALALSEERFRLAVSGATAGLWDWNLADDSVYFSPYFNAILGYGDHELPNTLQALTDAIHPDDVGRVTESLRAHLEERRAFDVEYRVRTKAGSFCWVKSRAQASWTSSGEPYRMVGWIIDITERKRDEEALRHSREELRRLSAHIQRVREDEKARIARELHDDLGQQVTALKMAVTLTELHLSGPKPPATKEELYVVQTMLDQLIDSIRRIAADLRPAMLDDLGLIPTIEWLTNDFSARYHVHVTRRVDADAIAFNRDSRIQVFRIVQEALTNVARHAHATQVTIEIVRDDPHCVVRIADNGHGAVSGVRSGRQSFGLLGMRERVALLGGEIQIKTAPGEGFALTARLPLSTIEAPQAR